MIDDIVTSLYFTYSVFCLLYSLPSSSALLSLFTVNKQVINVNKQMGVLGGALINNWLVHWTKRTSTRMPKGG